MRFGWDNSTFDSRDGHVTEALPMRSTKSLITVIGYGTGEGRISRNLFQSRNNRPWIHFAMQARSMYKRLDVTLRVLVKTNEAA